MGVIQQVHGDYCALLNVEHIVGRNLQGCTTLLTGEDISRSHATLYWKNGVWMVRDHSRNGTLVNTGHLHQSAMRLKIGDQLRFGRDQASIWCLSSDVAPTSYLQDMEDRERVLSMTVRPGIPQAQDNTTSFFYLQEAGWCAEQKGQTITLEQGTKLCLADTDWIFVDNQALEETVGYGKVVSEAYLQFTLSPDEERINVRICSPGWQMDLGERVHNYLLLSLARKKLADGAEGYASPDQGWILMEDLIADMSKEFLKEVDAYQVNLQIHRLRKQLLQLEPYGYLFSNMVERRKGELRFVHPFFEIVKDSETLYAFLPEKLI